MSATCADKGYDFDGAFMMEWALGPGLPEEEVDLRDFVVATIVSEVEGRAQETGNGFFTQLIADLIPGTDSNDDPVSPKLSLSEDRILTLDIKDELISAISGLSDTEGRHVLPSSCFGQMAAGAAFNETLLTSNGAKFITDRTMDMDTLVDNIIQKNFAEVLEPTTEFDFCGSHLDTEHTCVLEAARMYSYFMIAGLLGASAREQSDMGPDQEIRNTKVARQNLIDAYDRLRVNYTPKIQVSHQAGVPDLSADAKAKLLSDDKTNWVAIVGGIVGGIVVVYLVYRFLTQRT